MLSVNEGRRRRRGAQLMISIISLHIYTPLHGNELSYCSAGGLIDKDAPSAIFMSANSTGSINMAYNPQAAELNQIIQEANPHVFNLLSERGKEIFFPKKGILGQTADAAKCRINATIGAALEDDGSTMRLDSIGKHISINPEKIFPYTKSFGCPDIRKKWKEMLLTKNPSLAGKKLSLPIVTSAMTHGLSMCGYMFCNPGDKIILTDMFWGNYRLIFENMYGAQIETYPTFTENGSYNIKGLKKCLSSGPAGKRIVLLNFPNNPTGYTPTVEESRQIQETLIGSAENGNDILALIDDAYFGLVYEEGIIKESIFTHLADAHERILAVKIDGPTKEDYVWGFRIGFVTFGSNKNTPELYAALESKISGAIRGNISNSSHIGQSLLLAAYEDADYLKEKSEKYSRMKKRYKKIKEIFQSHPEYSEFFESRPFNSGYFMCIKMKNLESEQVRQRLLSAYGTGVIALGDLIRIAFSSTPHDLLETLFDNIYRACRDIKKA